MPFIWALGHNEKFCAFATVASYRGARTPDREHVTNSGESADVEVTPNEVDVVLKRVSVKASE